MIAQARFVFGLALGRRVTWEAQKRDGHRISPREAWRGLWPQMAFALLLAGTLALVAPAALPWAAPTLLACAFAVPFTCATAGPRLGRWMVRRRLCAIPDEYDAAAILRRVEALSRAPPGGAA
jgi:membrane glycosyltransferase